MYSTLNGAKKCAKKLKKILEDSNFIYPLHKCQEAVAKAGDYRSWHTLSKTIASESDQTRQFNYWGNLLKVLPVPCYDPVKFHLLGDGEYEALDDKTFGFWLRDVVPYSLAMAAQHRTTPVLKPGAGKNQRNRLNIILSLLLGAEGPRSVSPYLDPELISIALEGTPETLLVEMSKGPQFHNAVEELIDAGLLKVERKYTHVLSPDEAFRNRIIERAEQAKEARGIKPQYTKMDDKLATIFGLHPGKAQDNAIRVVPYDELHYQNVKLISRHRLAHEFQTMKKVVDKMSEDVSDWIISIFCDSKADAVYTAKVRQGKFSEHLANKIHDCFKSGTLGFNSLFIEHGNDPETAAYFESYSPDTQGMQRRSIAEQTMALKKQL